MSALAAPFFGEHYRVTAPATVSHPVPGPETFESIVDDYQRRLYGFALRMTGNREDAEEILQETLIRFLQTKPVFANDQHEKAWLLRASVARRVSIRARKSSIFLRSAFAKPLRRLPSGLLPYNDAEYS